jgi:hypothetical protein
MKSSEEKNAVSHLIMDGAQLFKVPVLEEFIKENLTFVKETGPAYAQGTGSDCDKIRPSQLSSSETHLFFQLDPDTYNLLMKLDQTNSSRESIKVVVKMNILFLSTKT